MNQLYIPQYFTLNELTKTDYRYNRNIPSFSDIINLSTLCEFLLDPLRQKLDTPIIVNSGFRDVEVNRLVGGVKSSYHLRGMAADICCHDIPSSDLFKFIKVNFVFSELGLYKSFVHVAYDSNHLDKETFVKL